MIALINSIVAGTGVTLLATNLLGQPIGLAMGFGVFVTAALMSTFLVYQRWRYRATEIVQPQHEGSETEQRRH
jgi:hypothetical protein